MTRTWAWGMALLSLACSGGGTEPGLVWLTVEMAAQPRVQLLAYEVSSAKGALLARGAVDVSARMAAPPIPVRVAPGYRHLVTVTALAADGADCAGVAGPFDVASRWVADVRVALSCASPSPPVRRPKLSRAGAGAAEACPALRAWWTSPLDTSVAGVALDVTSAASDADAGDLVTYAWTATGGTFSAASSAQSAYTCTIAGQQTLMVTASDNHEPVPCTASVTIPVTCHAP